MKPKICVVGLGYVGLPLAAALAKEYPVFGYDINTLRIEELNKSIDSTNEVAVEDLQNDQLKFTTDPKVIAKSNFVIITVPTPITESKEPDLSMVKDATRTVGKRLQKGSVVVFESTVYPGVTEEVCVPILEETSGLKLGQDFKVGYSPERINPGDKEHTVDKIVKVVSGSDTEALQTISQVYSSITKAGVYEATSIKAAEAAKVIENIQRDVNIALMNELKIIFDRLDIKIEDVLDAASTKWNFLRFYPGLVGGHCIGVDPYYLAYKAKSLGLHPEMILAGRRINDEMPYYHADKIIKEMIDRGLKIKGARVLILGATFKPDVRDLRNSKVNGLADCLYDYGCSVEICDPVVAERMEVFGYPNVVFKKGLLIDYDFSILAVLHRCFKGVEADYHIM